MVFTFTAMRALLLQKSCSDYGCIVRSAPDYLLGRLAMPRLSTRGWL